MAWTTPRTFVSGEIVTASIMNLHLRDQLNFLATFLSTGTLGTRSILVGSGTAPIAAVGPLSIGDIVVGSGATAVPTAVTAFTGTIGSLFVKPSFGGLGTDASVVAKGGLPVGSAAGGFLVKAVGSDGQILKADSTQAGGVKWANEQVLNLIVSGSGVTATGDIGIIATGTVSALALHDMIVLYYELENTGGTPPNGQFAVTLAPGIGSAGTGTIIRIPGSGTVGTVTAGKVVIMRGNGGTSTSYAVQTEVKAGSGTGAIYSFQQVDLPTSWTGSYAICLCWANMGGTSSGTYSYRWTVYKQPGT